jgi:hypothetical protein
MHKTINTTPMVGNMGRTGIKDPATTDYTLTGKNSGSYF